MSNSQSNTKGRQFIYVLVTLGFLLHLGQIFSFSFPKIKDFVKTNGSYDRMRLKFDGAFDPWQASQVIPEGAKIAHSSTKWDLDRIMTRYLLYPRSFSDDWDFYIDTKQTLTDLQRDWLVVRLPTGTPIYAKPDQSFTDGSQAVQPSFNKVLLLTLGLTLLNMVIGMCFCSFMNIPVRQGGFFWFCSTCYLIGFFVYTFVMWLLMILGAPFNTMSVWFVLGFILSTFVLLARGSIFPLFEELMECLFHYIYTPRDLRYKIIHGVGIFVVSYLFISIAIWPVVDWDSMLHWIMSAKVMFHHQAFAFEYPNLSYYPLLWPLNVAMQFMLLGTDYDACASLTAGIIFVAFVGQFWGALRILGVKSWYKWLPFMLYVTYFFHETFFYYKIAEPLYLAYFLGVVTFLLLWMKNQQDLHFLNTSIVFASALCLVKIEGAVACLIFCLGVLLAQGKSSSIQTLIKKLSWFLIPVFLVSGWGWWVAVKGYSIPVSHFESGLTLDKISAFVTLLIRQLLLIRIEHVCLIGILLLTCLFHRRRLSTAELFLLFVFLGYSAFSLFSVLGVYGHRLEGQMIWATPRVFFHCVPLLMLLWGSYGTNNSHE